MKKVISIFLFHSFLNIYLYADTKEISISFDDSPRAATAYMSGRERAKLLLENLKKADVQKVIFYSNTNGLDNEERKNRLFTYAKSGHLIGNHTHSHKRPSDLGVEGYIDDVLEAEHHLKKTPNFVKYFRYPYLDYGKTDFLRNGVRDLLKAHDYRIGYVTIDNSDWYMDELLQNAVKAGKRVDLNRLRDAYIYMLWDSIKFYDELAVNVLGRSPKHVLLLHENDLAALFIGDLIEFIRSKGWKIVTPEDAYSDDLSKIEPRTLKNSNGRISAVAEDRNFGEVPRDFFQNIKNVEAYFSDQKVFY